jgi:RecB family exonuclease
MEPIRIIPWTDRFVEGLGAELAARPDLHRHTVVFTHDRPRRYLREYFKQCPDLPRPCRMPEISHMGSFVQGIRDELSGPMRQANRLDRIELLYRTVHDLRREGRGLLGQLPELEREQFLPWGARLADLMEDLFRQDADPVDIRLAGGEVADYASALLEQLSAIHESYLGKLDRLGWTTPGLDLRFAAANTDAAAELFRDRRIVAAGFYALSRSEDMLMKSLWQRGLLEVWWHSDPELAEHRKGHWAVFEHRDWQRLWRAPVEVYGNATERTPDLRFVEGFDRHSQLKALGEELRAHPEHDDTAVVLPDPGALMPVLHHLPEEDVNISMGYPLDRTPLARLLDILIRLQENRDENGLYLWKDCVALLRHPFIRMLGGDEYRRTLHLHEGELRLGPARVDPRHWEPPFGEAPLDDVLPDAVEPVRREMLGTCLSGFATVETLAALADALEGLGRLLHEHGKDVLNAHLIDAECLYRLLQGTAPALRDTLASHEPFKQPVLFAMLRQELSAERVSFEPEPLSGMQVLGVLETRLLHFRKLILLDAVEERIPGTNPHDPLLPDTLRLELGLPGVRRRDYVAAYNFHRLIKGADEAVILYQSGENPGLLDSKSIRSRFVEQLLWEEEKKLGRVVEVGKSDLLRPVTMRSSAVPTDVPGIPVTEEIRAELLKRLEKKPLSPSRLDTYLRCPKLFFFEYMAGIREDSRPEDELSSHVGNAIHDTLESFLTPHLGRSVDVSGLGADILTSTFEEQLAENSVFRHLPFDVFETIRRTGRERLLSFLHSQGTATPLALEKGYEGSIEFDGRSIPFFGKLDRVDRRQGGIVILDYKTGTIKKPAAKFWEGELWDRMASHDPDAPDPLLLPDLYKSLGSVQLPAYLHIYKNDTGETPWDAALVELKDKGEEKPLFLKKWEEADRAEIIDDMIPRLLGFALRHMTAAQSFEAVTGRHCDWCAFRRSCGS